MGKKYNTYLEVSRDWAKKSPKKEAQKALHDIGVLVRGWVRRQHGDKSLPGESNMTIAMKGRSSPLKNTGGLSKAVSFVSTSGAVIIFSKNPMLQRLHEFGAKWKMTDRQRKFLMATMSELGLNKKRGKPRTTNKGWIIIPPRPIWRFALDANRFKIQHILKKAMHNLTK